MQNFIGLEAIRAGQIAATFQDLLDRLYRPTDGTTVFDIPSVSLIITEYTLAICVNDETIWECQDSGPMELAVLQESYAIRLREHSEALARLTVVGKEAIPE